MNSIFLCLAKAMGGFRERENKCACAIILFGVNLANSMFFAALVISGKAGFWEAAIAAQTIPVFVLILYLGNKFVFFVLDELLKWAEANGK